MAEIINFNNKKEDIDKIKLLLNNNYDEFAKIYDNVSKYLDNEYEDNILFLLNNYKNIDNVFSSGMFDFEFVNNFSNKLKKQLELYDDDMEKVITVLMFYNYIEFIIISLLKMIKIILI